MTDQDGVSTRRLDEKQTITMRNTGSERVGSPVELSRDFRFSIKDGTVAVPDHPLARHIGALNSPFAKRLAEMAIHEHTLLEAGAAVDLLRGISPDASNQVVIRMLWTAAVTTYTRSFAGHTDKLDANVIHGDNELAKGAHQYIWHLRSKHFAHDVNDRRRSVVGALIGVDGEFLGVAQWQGLTEFQMSDLNNLTKLIADALVYVRKERVYLEERLSLEIRALTPEQRLALPEPIVKASRPDTVETSRR